VQFPLGYFHQASQAALNIRVRLSAFPILTQSTAGFCYFLHQAMHVVRAAHVPALRDLVDGQRLCDSSRLCRRFRFRLDRRSAAF
jgi:hypothetical protein